MSRRLGCLTFKKKKSLRKEKKLLESSLSILGSLPTTSQSVLVGWAQKSAVSHIPRGAHLLPVEATFLALLLASAASEDYTVRGLLGKATDDFSEDGRLVEKTTYDHVTREKLDRILALIQGSHQKALVTYSSLDLQTQEAYEMAVRGLIRPMSKSPMLITGIRCLHFAPPEFLLEVQCMHETQKQLRRLVHEIGLELKTSAVCSQVRRTRDGCFTLDDALLRTQWDLYSIQEAIWAAAPRVAAELEKSLRLGLGAQQLHGPGCQWDSEGPGSDSKGRTAGGAAGE
ncbi:PREDICTED: probable tRNA pseudouridine synthase 2 isoform X2 [Miniopterus natalensis]|uniref:probable tRNA pseudouridine synthase 2 isoform X2 n=1 Tax=Miniopterus natalensis TaxID=291302 RepID=UPI0007A6F0EA|nr:PREDICTED: probable tRNA pseudouridine synthase 2 isoform X2 [Miniopterus natalensis]XP_016067311.1 PREDICTED: probable tRNA pseudouridine synthase 2 isoform X2 [Miniopterus natalensis]